MTFHRHLQQALIRRAEPYPVITLTGPRQSGKTTLCRQAFAHLPYANLEDANTRQFAQDDARGFLAQYPNGAILDEVQRLPDILSSVQVHVDEWRFGQLGQGSQPDQRKFILTGSQQLDLMGAVRQSLAGRTAVLRLLPLSMLELRRAGLPQATAQLLHRGGYPAVHANNIKPADFFNDYFETYVQRDLRELVALRNLPEFRRMVRLCAGRVGQVLNYHGLANDVGVSQTTITTWVHLLETGYVVFLLPPYFENLGKRLIKSPKLYFYDTGLAAWLMGIEDAAQILTHPMRGHLFENLVITEFAKYFENQGERARLHFWRDSNGQEVDLIVENGLPPGKLGLVEIKSSQTYHPEFAKSLRQVSKVLGAKVARQMVVYGGAENYVREGVEVVGVQA
ncbi:MAG: ATP-binding protein [Brachymonas sp.]|nr:ATP-binding protein [Brachymonas sp.]